MAPHDTCGGMQPLGTSRFAAATPFVHMSDKAGPSGDEPGEINTGLNARTVPRRRFDLSWRAGEILIVKSINKKILVGRREAQRKMWLT